MEERKYSVRIETVQLPELHSWELREELPELHRSMQQLFALHPGESYKEGGIEVLRMQ